jgi:acetyl esterase/lipase
VRQAPEALAAMAKDLLTPGIRDTRRRDRQYMRDVSVAALREVVPTADLDGEWPAAVRTPPIWDALRQHRYLYRRAVHYGDHPAQVLDVWRRKDLPARPAPVLVFLPGGAWVHGRCVGQGSALMSRLAEQGWVCLPSTIALRRITGGRATSSTPRPPSPGRAPTSTSSAATAISLP